MNYAKHYSSNATPQTERTPGRHDEVKNNAGGFVFQVDDWTRLERFLILGSEGGTYYVNERAATIDNAEAVQRLIRSRGTQVVATILKVSSEARAHKNDAAIFALAMCAKLGDEDTKRAAYQAMPQICRTSTHLFQFVDFAQAFGGWGQGMKRAVQRWYMKKSPDQLAYQLLKYRSRNGWSHRDVLRLAHPKAPAGSAHAAMFNVTAHPQELLPTEAEGSLPQLYSGYVQALVDNEINPGLIEDYNLSWEMLPTEWLKNAAVNKALLQNMPLMATVRQLGKMTANGALKPLSAETAMVVERLTNQKQIELSRIHPMHFLLAAKQYAAGGGDRGRLHWSPDNAITAALNAGFYKSFSNIEPTGKSFLVGLDVSGSMGARIMGTSLTAAEGAAAMALCIANAEPHHYIHGFCAGGATIGRSRLDQTLDGFVSLGITAADSLGEAVKKVSRPFGATDCAIPMLYALQHGIFADVFVVITDNETWAGDIKPVQALQQYRRLVNPVAKLAVIAMTSTGFSIADPNDAGMLDIVGFDASVPAVLSEFAR